MSNEFTDMKQFPSQLDRIESMLKEVLTHLEKPKRRQNGSASVTSAAFDAFWSLYPRKVSKPAAVRAWNGLNLTQQRKATAVIPQWTKAWGNEAIRFVPHAATWLNGHRFDDAVEMAVPEQELTFKDDDEMVRHYTKLGHEPKVAESMNAYKARMRTI